MTQADAYIGGRSVRQRSWSQRPDAVAWDPRRSSVPWTSRLLSRWALIVGAGALAIAFGWYLAAGDGRYTRQVGPLDLAILGLILAGAANVWVLLVARRTIGVRRRLLVGEAAPRVARPTPARASGGPVVASAGELFVGQPGLKRYHRADCPMARGKGWPAAGRGEHERQGLEPCQVCRP